MGRKRGSLRQYKPGTWHLFVSVPDPMQGRIRRCITFHGNRREAERELTRLVALVDRGEDPKPKTIRVADVLDEWLLNRRAHVAPRTLQEYEAKVNLYIRPRLGRVKLENLDAAQLEQFYQQLLESGGAGGGPLSPQTVTHVHRIIHAALELAVKRGHFARNIAGLADPPLRVRRELKAFSVEELRAIIEVARTSPIYPAVLLAAATGCRRGEVAALRWDDIDLEAGTVSFTRALSAVRKQGVLEKAPKTRKSVRVVPVSDYVVSELRRIKAEQAQRQLLHPDEYDPAGWVCATDSGRRMHPDYITREFASVLRAAGVQHGCFHTLRHTQATVLLQQGHNVALVSRRLGHSNIGITADTYGHVDPAADRKAAEVLGKLLIGAL